MRFLLFIFVLFFIVSCSKQKKIYKKIEGTWTFVKQINVDGSEEVKNDIYIFQEGSSTDGLPLFIYGSDTTELVYTVNKKGDEVKFSDPNDTLSEVWRIDFLDKDMLVLKTGYAFQIVER
ncbi:MAG: hypothetical protein ACK46Y_16970 [Fluviicola sp.]